MRKTKNKNQHILTNRRGFSLLEMIIITAIVAIMTSVMMVVTFQERDAKELETAGREVVAAIREAQNNALTGKQQGPGLPCAFRFWIDDPIEGTMYRVEGSYRMINENCPLDDKTGYSKILDEKDFLNDRIRIAGFTSNEKGDPGGGHESEYVVYVVPYGKYIDKESERETNPSLGTEFILFKEGDNGSDRKLYHICVHSTGLIEELGFVDNDPGNDLECIF